MCELFYIYFKMPLSIFITNMGINPNPRFADFQSQTPSIETLNPYLIARE
ncbi:hypothetical protein predicted by Glimmer/Critica [Helicobacter pylori B8]|uniref:Uncharacterized protein n=1 Tax=Helicobacter pylori (strain B8) TaxID=693745 RepID=D7FFK4_HELP3|nr:hypothetical protein predicted by Glimmer/Critica [Helicobacter pylori B8]